MHAILANNAACNLGATIPAETIDLRKFKLITKKTSDDVQIFKISRNSQGVVNSESVNLNDLSKTVSDHNLLPRQQRKEQSTVIFLKIDQETRDKFLDFDFSKPEDANNLPESISTLIKSLGISEESFLKFINLSTCGRSSNDSEIFNGFCLQENRISKKIEDLSEHNKNVNGFIDCTPVNVAYNQNYTLVVHNGDSLVVSKLISDITNCKLKAAKYDRMPVLTRILEDVVTLNNLVSERLLKIFNKFKEQSFRPSNTASAIRFKKSLTELQNYLVTEEDPVSCMEKLYRGIAKDCKRFSCTQRLGIKLLELIDNINLSTQKTLQLTRSLNLMENSRKSGVELIGQYISATIAAQGSAFFPNATVTQLPLGDGKIQLLAHCIATLFSIILLIRMKKLGWFDFVSENFGDLLGLKKIKQLFVSKISQLPFFNQLNKTERNVKSSVFP